MIVLGHKFVTVTRRIYSRFFRSRLFHPLSKRTNRKKTMAKILKSTKVTNEDLALSNRVFLNSEDYRQDQIKHVEVKTGPAHRYVFTVGNHPSVQRGRIAFSMPQRKWTQISLDQEVEVAPYNFDPNSQYIGVMTLEIDFQNKKAASVNPYDSDHMAREFLMGFHNCAFTIGQEMVFQFVQGEDKKTLFSVKPKEIEAADLSAISGGGGGAQKAPKLIHMGMLLPNSVITFDKVENSMVNLTGKSKGKVQFRSIINPDWDFQKMGIGGLDNQFSAIFRRAFASRVFPPEFIEQLGMKHVRGILLYGPPGTGKTLMARQIGQMLNAREPKIVNGPQILDKYVGESEANIRKLFADAEEEAKRMGPHSGLHIIIFDEIDAICKQRGSVAGSSAVHDTVVNQLLSKIDGVDQLNNILVIGMTNRRDMIDEALLRPGRLEVQMEISLPDEKGRVQILNIHTRKMREYEKLAKDVDVIELGALTKNFSGAELEGLVRAAQSSAMNRLVKAASKVEIDPNAIEKLQINREDFMYALANDVKPAFGHSSEQVDQFLTRGILVWGDPVRHVLEDGELLVQQAKSPDTHGLVSVLLEGPSNSGKTALAAQIAKDSDFPFIKVCSPEDMIGFTEAAKCATLRKAFDDSYKSPLSVLLVDNLERILDYGPIGPRYSNLVLQALLVLLKKQPPPGKKLLILATTSNRAVMQELEVLSAFSSTLHVSPLSTGEHIMTVIEQSDAFSPAEMQQLQAKLAHRRCNIGVRKLLDVVDLIRQSSERTRVMKFLDKLEEDGGLDLSSE